MIVQTRYTSILISEIKPLWYRYTEPLLGKVASMHNTHLKGRKNSQRDQNMTPNTILVAATMLGAFSRTTAFVATLGGVAQKSGWQASVSNMARRAGETGENDNERLFQHSSNRNCFVSSLFGFAVPGRVESITACCLCTSRSAVQ